MRKRYSISANECSCGLNEFYENAAKISREEITEKTCYDCRKICVTKAVQKCIWEIYLSEGFSSDSIASLLLMAGPKANLEGNSLEFEVEDGFVGSE